MYPELQTDLDSFRQHLLETSSEMTPLKVWQLQGECQEYYSNLLMFLICNLPTTVSFLCINLVARLNCFQNIRM